MEQFEISSGLTNSKIKLENCKNLNEVTDKTFELLSLSFNIVKFLRIGHTIEFEYRVGKSLDIHSSHLLILSNKGGYKKCGMIYCKKWKSETT